MVGSANFETLSVGALGVFSFMRVCFHLLPSSFLNIQLPAHSLTLIA